MNILIDINHPADVHQFKYLYKTLIKHHSVTVVARDKDCTFSLLEGFDIPFVARNGYAKGIIQKAFGLIFIELKLLFISLKYNIDLYIASSGNVYPMHIAYILRKRSILFDDTEHAKLQKKLSFPFATKIVIPDCYKTKFSKSQEAKIIRYKGFKELAYLDPNYFKPKKTKLLNNSILLRLVNWDASHDLGHKTKIDYYKLIKELKRIGNIYISSEGVLPNDLNQYRLDINPTEFHDYLATMSLVISEGGSVAAESAILGIPTIYINELELGYTDELKKEGFLFQTTDYKKILSLAKTLNGKKNNLSLFLKTKEDVNKFMLNLIENENCLYN